MTYKCSWKRGVKICERSSPGDTSEEGVAGGATGTQEQRPCRPWWGRCSPAAPQKYTVEELSTYRLQRTPRQSRQMCPAGSCDPVGSSHWGSFTGSACGPVERSSHWNRFADRACDPMGDPRQSSLFLKEFTLWKGFLLGQFMKDWVPWEGHSTGVRSLRRKEQQWQRVVNWLQPPFPVHLHCLGRGGGGIESEGESGKKGRREEGVFEIGFYYPVLLLINNKFHYFSHFECFTYDSNRWVISFSPLSWLMSFLSYFLTLSGWGGGVVEQLGGHCHPVKINTPQYHFFCIFLFCVQLFYLLLWDAFHIKHTFLYLHFSPCKLSSLRNHWKVWFSVWYLSLRLDCCILKWDPLWFVVVVFVCLFLVGFCCCFCLLFYFVFFLKKRVVVHKPQSKHFKYRIHTSLRNRNSSSPTAERREGSQLLWSINT